MKKMNVMVLPVVMMMALGLSGCSEKPQTQTQQPGGTYLSTSAGANFDQVGNLGDYDLGKIERSQLNPATIVIAAGAKGMVLSADDGTTWQTIPVSLSATIDVIQLKTGVLLASGVGDGGQGSVLRSIDGGKSWHEVFTLPLPQKKVQFQIIKGPEALPSTITSLVVDGKNPDRVWAGTNDGTIFVADQAGKVWRHVVDITSPTVAITGDRSGAGIVRMTAAATNDADLLIITKDKRFIQVLNGVVTQVRIPEAQNTTFPYTLAVDSKKVLDVSRIPGFPDALIAGTDTGVVVTRDKGKSWIALNIPFSASKVIASMQVAVSPTNVNRILVAADGVVYRSEDGGVSWNTTTIGPVGYGITDISINPKNAGRMLAVLKPVKS